jgi:hypothetical protein
MEAGFALSWPRTLVGRKVEITSATLLFEAIPLARPYPLMVEEAALLFRVGESTSIATGVNDMPLAQYL